MGSSCIAAPARWLRVAILVAGCVCRMAAAQDSPTGPATVTVSVGNVWMNQDEWRDFTGQPPAERRRRLDAILAAHPDSFGARYLRVEADDDLPDFPAIIEDSDALLADASLDRRLRVGVLVMRAEALIQLKRFPEAVAAASESVDIDDSNAKALFARAWACYLSDHGLAQSALADLDRALQIESDVGIAYYRRSVIHKDQGRFDLATQDLDRAAQLAPDDGPIREEYGLLYFAEWYSGQFKQPIDVFREQATRPEASSYAPLWLFLMRVRADPAKEAAARAELVTLSPAHQPHAWLDTLVGLMAGTVSLDAALAEADAAETYQLKAGHRCEADYYVAEQLLAHGQRATADTLLEEAYWVCPSTYVEAGAVVAERRRLEAGSPTR